MSSFYGNHSVWGGGSGGTTNYNDLINKPVINKTGTESSPIILNALGYGEYIITGNFVYTNKDNTLKGGSFPTYISILQDGITLKKIAKYETFEDGIYYINTVSFNDDETCLIDKISIIKNEGLSFIKEADLPEVGTEDVLYITERDIYRWDSEQGDYVSINTPLWSTI